MWYVKNASRNDVVNLALLAFSVVTHNVKAEDKLSDSLGKNPQEQVRSPSSVQVGTCESMTKDFKTIESQNYFIDQCFDHYLGSAKPGAVKFSDDNSMMVFAANSMLFSKIGDQKFVITGAASRLANAQNVAIDTQNKEAWVLDGDHLYAFQLGESGNRAPLRGFEGKWIRGISAISVDATKDEIYVLNPKIQRVIVYDRKSDMLYRSSSKKLAPKREVYSHTGEIVGGASLVFCAKENQFGVLSPAQNKLNFFSTDAKGWSKPVR
jgi:hypothetical protein